jgi:hypothetical protein
MSSVGSAARAAGSVENLARVEPPVRIERAFDQPEQFKRGVA